MLLVPHHSNAHRWPLLWQLPALEHVLVGGGACAAAKPCHHMCQHGEEKKKQKKNEKKNMGSKMMQFITLLMLTLWTAQYLMLMTVMTTNF